MIAINLNLALSSLPPETVTALVDQLIRHAGTDSDTTHRLIRIEKEMLKMDQKLQDEIVKLQAAVANDTAVGTSAVTLLEGVGVQLATAIQAAKDAGASADQLKALTDLETAIGANATGLAAAVTKNTPVVPPVVPPVAPLVV